ncbi:MAG: hypothetical protein H6937_05700 [Burkholderiales bacterium]|nr:hypothetical protein [Burkholderiales bacterium]
MKNFAHVRRDNPVLRLHITILALRTGNTTGKKPIELESGWKSVYHYRLALALLKNHSIQDEFHHHSQQHTA